MGRSKKLFSKYFIKREAKTKKLRLLQQDNATKK